MSKINYRNYEYIVLKNIPIVYRIVSKFDIDNIVEQRLIDAGIQGLVRAAIIFDSIKQENFEQFAVEYILNDIRKEIRKQK